MSVFFTSDTHFSHRHILTYTDRPFRSVDEMDAALIERWNATVSPRDEVWHLGDFCLSSIRRAVEVAKSLQGRKHIVWGNHDKSVRKDAAFLAQWESHHDLVTVKVHDETVPGRVQRIVVCHYAMKIWDRSHHGAWHLFGHSHGTMPDDESSLSLDVGVDAWIEPWVRVRDPVGSETVGEIIRGRAPTYAPVSYEKIKKRMSAKTYVPVDAHGKEHSR
jgi:calcineurin-like phosphoesterase family protein